MARSTFSVGTLNAATPGISRLAQALAGAGGVRKNAEDQEMGVQSRIAQTMAEAQLRTAQAQQEAAKTGILNRRPDLYNEQVANAAGTDMPTVGAFRSQLRTGQAPLVPMGPPTEEGAMGQGSLVLPDAVKSKIAGALQQFLPVLANGGDLNPEQMAKAAGIFRESDLSDRIINGSLDRNRAAGAQAAASGKAIYNTNGDGAVLDQYGGGLDTNNPMARATIGLRGAQAGEASARGRLATAQAGEVGAPKFDAGSGLVIDARSGTGRAVIGPDGKPIGGKASGGLNQEQANALGFGTRMQDADTVLARLAQQGIVRPSFVKAALDGVPVAGDLANYAPTEGQQEVEQAQRNFINAVLRRESGASISPAEFDNARKQYFPQPGDKAGVLAQKAANRQRSIQTMLAAVPPGQRDLPQPGVTPASKPIAVDY